MIPKSFLMLFYNAPPDSHLIPRKPSVCFLPLYVSVQFLEIYINDTYSMYPFFSQLLLPNIIIVIFTHVAVCINSSFLFTVAEQYSLYERTTVCLSVHLLIVTWVIPSLEHLQIKFYEHLHRSFSVDMCFLFSWINSQDHEQVIRQMYA